MKLVTYKTEGGMHLGAVVGDQVVHLNGLLSETEKIPENMVQLIAGGDAAMGRVRLAVARFEQGTGREHALPLAQADLQSPVLDPGKIMMGGRNYLRHLDELRAEGKSRDEKIITPPMPHIFAKYPSTITGPGKPVVYPKIVKQLDLEGELTVIIGKRAHFVSEADALDHVAGYTIMNDVSARCIQAMGLTHISKGFETFAPMGPWMVTPDELTDPQNLNVRTFINDREVCKAHTSEMLFNVRQFISFLSTVFPLEPGDVLATGSPPGPGMYHNPPMLVKVGDVMRVDIEGIGTLSNPVVAAQR